LICSPLSPSWRPLESWLSMRYFEAGPNCGSVLACGGWSPAALLRSGWSGNCDRRSTGP
jgi:hypothetical protein